MKPCCHCKHEKLSGFCATFVPEVMYVVPTSQVVVLALSGNISSAVELHSLTHTFCV